MREKQELKTQRYTVQQFLYKTGARNHDCKWSPATIRYKQFYYCSQENRSLKKRFLLDNKVSKLSRKDNLCNISNTPSHKKQWTADWQCALLGYLKTLWSHMEMFSMLGYKAILVSKYISRNWERCIRFVSPLCDVTPGECSLWEGRFALAHSLGYCPWWWESPAAAGHTVSAIRRRKGRWVFSSPFFSFIQYSVQVMAWCHSQFKAGLP